MDLSRNFNWLHGRSKGNLAGHSLGTIATPLLHLASNMMLKDGSIPPCPRHVIDGENPIPMLLLRDSAYSLMPYLMKEYANGEST